MFTKIPPLFEPLAKQVSNAMQFTKSMVPSRLLQEVQHSVSMEADKQEALCKELMGKAESDSKVHLWMFCQQSRKTAERLAYILSHYTMDLDKETRLNTLYYKVVSPELSNLGFVVKSHIEHSDSCLFGKSVSDLYFYKENGSVVLATLMNEEKANICIGATAEFKREDENLKNIMHKLLQTW